MPVSKSQVDLIDASLKVLKERRDGDRVIIQMDSSTLTPLCDEYKRWRYAFASERKGKGRVVYKTCRGCPVLKVTGKHGCSDSPRDDSHWLRVWLLELTVNNESLEFRLRLQRMHLRTVIHWLENIRETFIYGRKDYESNNKHTSKASEQRAAGAIDSNITFK